MAVFLEADRAAAKRSEECGFACDLGSVLAEGAFYLHNGMPLVYGADVTRGLLLAQDTVLSQRVQWQPFDARLSADATFGITWGVTSVGLRGGPVRFGRYITAWQRAAGGWRIAAHVQTALNDVAEVRRPHGWLGAGDAPCVRGPFEDVPFARAAHWPAMVSWAEGSAYARWRGARLPTEAEWQRAARGTPSIFPDSAIQIYSLDLNKTAQFPHIIEMKFYIFNKINFSMLINRNQDS